MQNSVDKRQINILHLVISCFQDKKQGFKNFGFWFILLFWCHQGYSYANSPPEEIFFSQTNTAETQENIPESIVVDEFEFVGNTVFTAEELKEATVEFVGKPLTFTQLLQATNKITQLYVQQGYITSGAYLPSQEMRSGIVKIQVVEGSLAEINIKITQGRLNPNYVRSRLGVTTNKPLNINHLQEALQLLQLNPLIENIKAELTAGTTPGTNILEVQVAGAKTFNTTIKLDNNRNPSVGSFERGIEISEANLLGIGDGINLAYANTDGSNQVEVNYTVPVNPQNGSLNLYYQYTDNKIIEPPFDQLDLKTNSHDFEFTYKQPVIQRATPEINQELALSLSAARRETTGELLGVNFPLSPGADNNGETKISALRLAQEWTQRGKKEVLAARSQFSLGVSAFDATVNDNDEPDSQFFAWRGQLIYLNLLAERKNNLIPPTLLLRSDVQLATDSLLPIEQFSLGGQATVRGYRQDALLTDNGIFASAEVRVPIVQVPEIQGSLQVTPFLDFGTGWNVNRNNPDSNVLLGVGFGLLWEMQDRLRTRIDWGIPLIDTDSRERTWQENGIYLQLEYKLF